MKDLHTHILYGVDDGSKTINESLELLKEAQKNGITDIVLTPHYIKDSKYNINNEKKKKLLTKLKKEANAKNIRINLYLGNEVLIDESIISLYKEISTINNSRYILIELPLTTKYPFLEEVLINIKERGLVPIIAHPERYQIYYNDYNFFQKLINTGCLMQGNIGSLYGIYGGKTKKMLKELLKRNMIHFLASDIHHQGNTVYKKNIYKDLFKIVKSSDIVNDLLENNPNKVINDIEIKGVVDMNENSITKINSFVETKEIRRNTHQLLYFAIKRLIDVIGSLIGLIVLSPLFLLIIILIKREDKGQAIFIQERIGKDGKIFNLYKFRSMINDADKVLEEMLKDEKIRIEYKKKMKLTNDPRITKIGHFLRKTSMDELPQLINVLKGEMSLIGNRPYLPREKKDMGIYYNEIIKTKPGITGYWQVSGRSKISFKERCKLESYYSNHQSFQLDFKIFFLTFYVVLLRKGAE